MISKYNRKIVFLQHNLIEWYKTNGRQFYWRKPGLSNYKYIIAEVLLQRTKAETVAKFYPKFIETFPNWNSLKKSNRKKIEEYLKPLGLYRQRSKRLISLANEMVTRNGRLPRDRKELESIPLMGQYISNAVELIIYNKQSPLIDVNMARIIDRFFGPRKMVDIRFDSYLQNMSLEIVLHKYPKKINWAILDFAALVCKARNPLCKICMLNSKCIYCLKQKKTTYNKNLVIT